MPRVPCPECAIDVVVDPSGRCPEGHLVAPTAPPAAADAPPSSDARPPVDDSSSDDPPAARLDDLGELAALEAAVERPARDDRDPAPGDLDPVFARFAELMREREPESEDDERGGEPFTIWDGPDAESATPAPAEHADGPLFPEPTPTPAPPEPPAATAVPSATPAPPPPSKPAPVPRPRATEAPDPDRSAKPDEPARPPDNDAGPPMAPLKDGWVGFTARSSPTPGRKRRG